MQVGFYIFGATAAGETFDIDNVTGASTSLYRLPVSVYETLLGASSVGICQIKGRTRSAYVDSYRFDEVFSYSGNDVGAEEPLETVTAVPVREGLTAPNTMGEGSVYDVRFAPMLHDDDAAVIAWGIEDLLPNTAITSPGTVTFPNRTTAIAEATRVLLSSLHTTRRTSAIESVDPFGSPYYEGTWEAGPTTPAYLASAPLRDLVNWQWAGANGAAALEAIPYYRATNSDGAFVQFSTHPVFSGGTIAVGVIDVYTGAAVPRVSITVDGDVPRLFNLGGVAETTDGRRAIPRVFRVTDVPPGAHLIQVTHIGTVVPLIFDYWAIEGASPRVAVAALHAPTGIEIEAPDIASTTTIGRSDQNWLDNDYVGKTVAITTGTGAGQVRNISANTATTLTTATAWTTTPNSSSTFRIADPGANKEWSYVSRYAVTLANAALYAAVNEFPNASLYDLDALGDDTANYTNATEPSASGAEILASEAGEALSSTAITDYASAAMVERAGMRAASAEISAGGSVFLGVDSVDIPTMGAMVTNTGKGVTVYRSTVTGTWSQVGDWETSNLFPLPSQDFDEDATGFEQAFGAATTTGGPQDSGIEAGTRSLKAIPPYGHTESRFALGVGAAGSVTVQPGDVVTVRLHLRKQPGRPAEAGVSVAWSFFSVIDADVDGARVELTTDWVEHSWTFTVPANRYGGNFSVKFQDPAYFGPVPYIEVDKIAVSIGGTLTEWMPSLGDLGSGLVRVSLEGTDTHLAASVEGIPAVSEDITPITYDTTHGIASTRPGARFNDFNIGRTLHVTLKDYEAAPGVPHTYRAYALSANKEIRSLAEVVGMVIPPERGFWLKDPLNPASNLRIRFAEDDLISTRSEEQGVFEPGGRRTAVVVSGIIRSDTISGWTIGVTSDAQRDAVLRLLNSGRTLLFQTPMGKQWYVRPGADISVTNVMGTVWQNNAPRLYEISVSGAVEVDVP